MAKEKKPSNGKGIKVFAIIFLILAFGCIGYGTYLIVGFKPVETAEEPEEETIEEAIEELDIKSEEVTKLFASLSFNEISAPKVDDSVKDYYYTKTEVNDDLKLFLAFMANDKVKGYQPGAEVVIPTSELEETITTMFDTARTDDYKNMNLGNGLLATYDANAKTYTISSIGEVEDESKYYGEVTSATKENDTITLTVTTYYASLEQGDNKAVYKIYKDSTKADALSEESYETLPELSKVPSDKMDSYSFVFTSVDGVYKLTSFEKIVKE